MERHRMNIPIQSLTIFTWGCLAGGSLHENLQAQERAITSSQLGIQQPVQIPRAGLPNDRQVVPISDVQPLDYRIGSANRGRKVHNNICQSCHGTFAKG
ncbi:MAG: hypothetical protein ABI618_00500 [Nitrospirota bacterium]